MNLTPQHAQSVRRLRRLLILVAVLLGVFAIYAPALRLMPFYDDIGILPMLGGRNLFSIFTNMSAVDENYRPLSYVLWLLIRDLFHSFIPAFLHAWNVWLHTLNIALLAALAWRLARLFNLNQILFTILCVLIFGLFPFSYEAVLWAAAVNHLLMTTFGLSAILVYLSAREPSLSRPMRFVRLALSGLLLLAACLSHEMGFIFGALLLLIEAAYALTEHRWPRVSAVALFVWSLIYPLVYQLTIRTLWATGGAPSLASNTSAWYPNALIQAQGMVAWLIVILRDMIGLPDPRAWIVLVAFVVAVGITLVGLWYARRLRAGLLALAWWLVAMLPSTIVLSEAYLSRGPRLLYESSIGVALLWATAITCLVQAVRWPLVRLVVLGCVSIFVLWCVSYIAVQRDEIARLTPALQMIGDDMRRSNPADKVLLVNMPWWSAPANPVFLLGTQGMQIFQEGHDPVSNWLASVSGVHRQARAVRHESSLTHGDQVQYAIYGAPVDDMAMRKELLRSNLSYRFDYESPGLRVERLAQIGHDQTATPPLAKFSNGDTQVALRSASAALCGARVAMQIVWSDVRNISLPTGVLVHVIDVQDRQAIVADRDLIDGYLPLDQVPPGMVITESRKIDIPPAIAPLKEVRLGAYIRAGVTRMVAARADGSQWEGNSVSVPIQSDNPDLCRRIGG